jgi:lipopolysaccharide transport protein LptA
VGVCLALLLPACAAAPLAGAESPRVAIGVAAFEAVGATSATDLDIATLLADRIGTRGVHAVAGPAQLGGGVIGEPTPAQVQAWAAAAGVSTLAVGRATRIGGRQSLDVRLRDGNSGGLIGTFIAEAATPEELAPAVDRLAGQIVDATVEWLTADVATAPGPAGTPPTRGRALRSKDDPFGMTGFDRDQPLSIHSDELDASQDGGARRFVFSKNVKVEQGDLRLESARMEAFYPENATQPDRLVASGGVHVVQGTREARCDEATYYRTKDLLVCEGHAELHAGDDQVAGAVIEFDLLAEKVLVRGGATVLFHPEPEKPQERARGDASADPPAVAP